ncbi:MAG: OmpA family protein [Alphaproteobacteria bacterium]|nr:OmpA family protein [Alphaproteobacteria bacterium]MCL2505830.1 OmpA family protein [Alphaproteobacteria bacterium]
MSEQPTIIIKKKKKHKHPHHGGAWKVAYADFVTAMMSFFLLLWLLQVTTSEQRAGLADYFSTTTLVPRDSIFGAGHVFGTRTSATIEVSDESYLSDDEGFKQGGEDHYADEAASGAGASDHHKDITADEMKLVHAMQKEEAAFKEAGEFLRDNILNDKVLREFADQIIIDRTPEGLRIQVVDKGKSSMFPSASAVPYQKSRDLLMLIGKVIGMLPNKISVSGHTDSSPFPTGSSRDNWTLSTERANVSRMYLVKGGIAEEQITRVVGFADKQSFSENPADPRNRRISIILLRMSGAEAGVGLAVPEAAKE